MIRILLAEDTRDMNRALTALLTHEKYTVDSVFDGEEALDHLRQNAYDAVILDIMMPKKDGLEVLREIRSDGNTAPVLLLTAKAEIDDRVNGLDAGADDYLTKPFAMKELLARVRSMTRRHTRYSGESLRFGNLQLSAENFELRAENAVRLSIKDFELMQILMKNSSRPLDTSFLLQHVWGGDEEAGEDTVWLYISYLRNKLRAVAADVTLEGSRGGSFFLAVQAGLS
ncbi:MAG: response regulator transcription factor [Lachnospiraceae bacterium]|nr:response regulator transcription factor [Lachnospiraceae bacterium]